MSCMRNKWYKLVGREVEALPGFPELGEGLDDPNRQIALTYTPASVISTVFMSLDHRHNPDEPPVLFETMVFRRELGEDTGVLEQLELYHDFGIFDRYHTFDEAERGHQAIVEKVRKIEAEAVSGMAKQLQEVFRRPPQVVDEWWKQWLSMPIGSPSPAGCSWH